MPKYKDGTVKLNIKADLTEEMGKNSRALGKTVRKMWDRRRKEGTPTQIAKNNHWKELTDSERRRILARSREHLERLRILQIPQEEWYGPVPVLEMGARWDGNVTTNTTIHGGID
jgi:hypothetical protein